MNIFKRFEAKLDEQAEILEDLKGSVSRLTELIENPPDRWSDK